MTDFQIGDCVQMKAGRFESMLPPWCGQAATITKAPQPPYVMGNVGLADLLFDDGTHRFGVSTLSLVPAESMPAKRRVTAYWR